jgi:hypothetical protein
MKCRIRDLDHDTRDYLEDVSRSWGAGFHGIFIARGEARTWWRVLLALLALTACAWMSQPRVVKGAGLPLAGWQAVFAGVAVLGFLSATRLRRARRACPVRNFLFADALNLYETQDGHVKITDLTRITDCRGTHHYENGVYQRTAVTISLSRGMYLLQLRDKSAAEKLVIFLNCLIGIRSNPPDSSADRLEGNPALLGALAMELTNGASNVGLGDLDAGRPLPEPSVAGAGTEGGSGKAIPWLAALLVTAGGFFGFPILNRTLYERDLYGQIQAKQFRDLKLLDLYLSTQGDNAPHSQEVREKRDDLLYDQAKAGDFKQLYPLNQYLQVCGENGRHTAEILEKRDDLLFAEADSPAKLREYLADGRNTRHRDEIKKRMNEIYTQAIQRLHDQAKGKEKDERWFNGLVSLLVYLKDTVKPSGRPVITVGFKPTFAFEPTTEEQRKTEKEDQDNYEKEFPALVQIARDMGGSSIIKLGDTFSPEHVERRHVLILERFREAVNKVLAEDIITLEMAPKGEDPILEINYHTYACGQLYIYTQTTQMPGVPQLPVVPGIPGFEKPRGTAKGMLREYRTNWKININTPGTGEECVFKLESHAAREIQLRTEPSDPNWAPYAIMLYSSFHDLSNRLIKGLTLEPPSERTSFSFAEASGFGGVPVVPGGPGRRP